MCFVCLCFPFVNILNIDLARRYNTQLPCNVNEISDGVGFSYVLRHLTDFFDEDWFEQILKKDIFVATKFKAPLVTKEPPTRHKNDDVTENVITGGEEKFLLGSVS